MIRSERSAVVATKGEIKVVWAMRKSLLVV